jgi:ABC-type multidrug transport system fused ATPase/permease subunit
VTALAPARRPGHLATLRLLARTLRYVAPFRWRFTAKFALLLVSMLPLLVLPWPAKIVLDHVIEGIPIGEQARPYPTFLAPLMDRLAGLEPFGILLAVVGFQLLAVLLVGAAGSGSTERDSADAYLSSGHDQATRTDNEANAGFSVASGLVGLFDLRFTIRLTQAVNHFYRSHLFGRIQALPLTTFDDQRIGDAVFRVLYDTPALTSAVYRILFTPAAAGALALAVVVTLRALYGDHPILWESAFLLLGIAFVVALPFAGALRRRSLAARSAGASATSSLEEGLANVLAVQSLGAESHARARFDLASWGSFQSHRALLLLGMAIFCVAVVPALWVAARVFSYVAGLVVEGELSRGDFLLLFTYYLMLAFSCVELGSLWLRVQESAAGLERVFFLMDLPSETDPPDAEPLAPLASEVRLEDVHHAWPDGTSALRGVSLGVRVGEVTGLVGPAGAGKTTIAYLIPRFVEPQQGRVTFDGKDVRRARRAALRAQISFVFQETALFDATVEENLRVGDASASDAALRRAARVAGADEFIRALPQGYQTPLGRSGAKLSVGQRQRLSIARALVRDPRLLILDEPTSALDPETEHQLVRALREASRERAVLVIAHRLSTVRDADVIHFVEAGRIIESGNHEQLMARPDGAYRRFVELQAHGAPEAPERFPTEVDPT